MKKSLLIAGLLALIALTFGFVSTGFAQSTTPATPEGTGPYYGQGGRGMRGSGFMSGGFYNGDGEHGPLHEAILSSMSEALGIDAAALEERLENGETMYAIAESLGFAPEEFQALMLEARQQAFEQAVADGILSPEQAEWMQSRMQGQGAAGYGPASGNCDGSGQNITGGMGRRGGMRGGR